MRRHFALTLLACFTGSAMAVLIEPKGELTTKGEVPVSQPFRVFGKDYPTGTTLYMNPPSGRISIGSALTANLPLPDKAVVPANLIQPAELFVLLNMATQKMYATNITGALLANMTLLVQENFWNEANFSAHSGQLLTWEDQRPSANAAGSGNTFQVAIIFGSSSTYALFNYHEMKLTQHMGQNIEARFSRANSHDLLNLPFSGTHLVSTSGLADRTPGRFIYRVDAWPPTRGGCLSADPTNPRDRTLSTSLVRDSVLGGSVAIVSSRCPDASSVSGAVCRVATGDGRQLAQRPAVRCDRCGSAFLACEMPPALIAGPAVLELRMTMSGARETSVYSHSFSVASPDDSSVTKIHLNDSMDNWMQLEPASLMISYDSSEAANGSLKLQVVGYSEAGLSQMDRDEDFKTLTKVLYEGVASSTGSMNLAGKFVRCPAGNADCENYHIGFLRILDSATPPNTLKSRIIPLGWFVHPYYMDKSESTWPAAKCKAWHEAKSNPEAQKVAAVLQKLACPGQLNQAIANPGEFMPATYCPNLPGGCDSASPSQQCLVSRPGFDTQLQGVPAAVCCYSPATGSLLYQEMQQDSTQPGQQMGSGSLRSHPHGQLSSQGASQPLLPGQASYLSTWYWDALPRLHCCRWSTGTGDCQLRFMLARPTPRTSIYTAAQPSHMVGDPHLVSFNGRRFLFNGLGEYWLLTSETGGIALQGRYQLASSITPQNAGFLTALAGRPLPGSGDIVEVTAVSAGFRVQHRRQDWEPSQTITAELQVGGAPLLIGGGIAVQLNTTDRMSMQLYSGADSVGVELKLVTVGGFSYMDMFLTLSPSLKARTRGLLGQWIDDSTKEFIDAHGSIAPFNSNSKQFHDEFCIKNNISFTESLFGYSGSGSRAEGFNGANPDRALHTLAYNDSELTVHPEENSICGISADCRFDIRVTTNTQVAAATAANGQMFDDLRAASDGNVSVCDVPALPGLRIDQPLTEGSSLILTCAQPLLTSRSGLTIVCTRLAGGSVTWQPDPAGLGFQCTMPVAETSQANIGLIVGIVVPCVILLLVVIVVVIVLMRQRSGKHPVRSTRDENSSFLAKTHSAGPPGQTAMGPPPHLHKPPSSDEGNRRNPHGVPQHAASLTGYSGVPSVDSDDRGGQFVPMQQRTSSPQPVPAQRRSFDRAQQAQVRMPDDAATLPQQQQQQPVPHQKPRSSKQKPAVSHSELV